MVRKNILCCSLLAGALFFASSFTNPAATPAPATTVASLTTTDTYYFTVNGRSADVTITYFVSGGIYSTPIVTIAGIGSYPMTNVSHSPASGPIPNVDGFHATIAGPDADYIIDAKIHGFVNNWWAVADVTADYIVL